MTSDNEKDMVTIKVNYAKLSQYINGAIFFLSKVKDALEKAEFKKKHKNPHKMDRGAW